MVAAVPLAASRALADGAVVDKVYAPYVTALEREIEYRVIAQNDKRTNLDGFWVHRLGFGASLNDRWFGEVYVTADRTHTNDFSLAGYELEALWQLTEQGEFWMDWGLLFEIETERDAEFWEYSTTLLTTRAWGRWVATTNLGIIYESGDEIEDEWETALSIQGRYRLTRGFEPAVEFYAGQDTRAAGPAFVGDIPFGGGRKLHWELGVIFAIDDVSPNQTFRGLLEFEF
ncbi:MAG: hypothetical protein ACE5G3_01510 [Gammaproteobacteria bacterium]